MSRLTRDGTGLPNPSRETKFSGTNKAYHEQDWQPYPVDCSLAICDDNTYLQVIESISRELKLRLHNNRFIHVQS